MKNLRILAAAAMIGLATAFTGCVATVGVPPPAARVEVRPAVPYYGAVWVGGHYEYSHSRYIWVPGRYVRQPYNGARWVPGNWQQHRHGWRWHRGHWR